MRKDVKLGFAIGGVLLAVLIVYVLVVPEPEISDVHLVDAEGKPLIIESFPARENGASAVATTPPSAPVAEMPEPPAPQADAGQNNVASASPENRSDVDWDALLGGGEVLMTTTPAVPGPRAEVSVEDQPAAAAVAAPPVSAAPPVGEAAPTTRPSGSRTHVVQSGETLSSIAKAAYGSANFYPQIINANPGIDANRLKVGAVLTLPAVDEVVPSSSSPPAQPISSDGQYRVQSGDSLYSISVRLYGSAERMSELYELNKAAIGADPSKLKLDMVLKLPAPPTRTASR